MIRAANRSLISKRLMAQLYPEHTQIQFSRTRTHLGPSPSPVVFWAYATAESRLKGVKAGKRLGRHGKYNFSFCFNQLVEIEQQLESCRLAFSLGGGHGFCLVEVDAKEFFGESLRQLNTETSSFYLRRPRGAKEFRLFMGGSEVPVTCRQVCPWQRQGRMVGKGRLPSRGRRVVISTGDAGNAPAGCTVAAADTVSAALGV